ncbi:MAG: 50S ribosomal protein L22 [Bacteroidetes bacterium]|nr:50S ribosomal protein L22 [Bacteroidota bacterium]
MGIRKRQAAENRKEILKSTAIARLVNVPTSPRKMRVVADLIRGQEVTSAMNILKYNAKASSARLEILLQSAISNWESKTGEKIDEGKAYVKSVNVDSARMLKRLKPAPQGRAYRVRKRSNHVTIILDSMANKSAKSEAAAAEETK